MGANMPVHCAVLGFPLFPLHSSIPNGFVTVFSVQNLH